MPRRLALLVLGCVSAACSQPSAPAATPAPAPPPLVSGLEAASFDKTVRPQDDLFRFVNGGWLARTEIPADKPAYGGFYEAFDRSQEQLKVLVEAAASRPARRGVATTRRSATSTPPSWTRPGPNSWACSPWRPN